MKQFRSQRNFYIAGFALFLWLYVATGCSSCSTARVSSSVIKRLINLLSDVAREMADSAAARKQAEGAHRHMEGLASGDASVRFGCNYRLTTVRLCFRKSILGRFRSPRATHHVTLTRKNTTRKSRSSKEVRSRRRGRARTDGNVGNLFAEALKAREDIETLREQYDKSVKQYDELNAEHRKLEVSRAVLRLVYLAFLLLLD